MDAATESLTEQLSLAGRAWVQAGKFRELCGHQIFVVDEPAVREVLPPLLIIHGFPTSSLDFLSSIEVLRQQRRVVTLDLLGFGLSAKPDIAYTLETQADICEALLKEFEISHFSLLTHDMGDTVGGELLARCLEGTSALTVSQRVVTNGSIYINKAHLTDGQQLLLSLPDERLDETLAPTAASIAQSLADTTDPSSGVSADQFMDHALLIAHLGGNALLSRTIRYVEQRRANEQRYTGAIESHPSPLGIVWGDNDPIAVAQMARDLATKRPDADLRWLHGVGHYPQLEAPKRFTAELIELLAE